MLGMFNEKGKEKVTGLVFLLVIFFMLFGMLLHFRGIGSEFLTAYREGVPAGAAAPERVRGAVSALDGAVNAGAPARRQFIEVYGLAQLAMNRKIVIDPNYGALYKTPYGQITHAVEEKYLDVHLSRTYDLVNALIQERIPFLYVQAPFKLPDAHSQVPLTVTDHSNSNADEFVEKLVAANVSCLDLRPLLWGSGMTQNQLFYDTDHHWTIDAALYSVGRIAERLNADYGFDIDPELFAMDNYNRVTYRNFYVGSMGRRVGRLYGGVDDFTLITPKFGTDISLSEDGRPPARGPFEEVVLNREYIDEGAPKETNRYAVYHGDNAELIFENHLAEGGKLLIIKDSFGIPVYSFLSLGIREVRAIDVRLFTEDVAGYAAGFGPDAVMMIYNADCFSDVMFDFGEKES